jgi:3'(2'), 5'-bisphosphate nucleotidase
MSPCFFSSTSTQLAKVVFPLPESPVSQIVRAVLESAFMCGTLAEMIEQVKQIARLAGQHIQKLYEGEPLDITIKSDASPVTAADLEANEIILKSLKRISNFPILSEEAVIAYPERRNWHSYWIVDPLDGTKGFINRTGDFTVNIALIENETPVLGVIHVPKTDDLYWAEKGGGAFKNGSMIRNSRQGPMTIAVASKLHGGHESEWLKKLGITEVIYVNSSLKLCWLAEGKADLYPRLKPTMEWDTAAGEIILTESGCEIVGFETLAPLPHNQEDLMNPSFVAYRKTAAQLIARSAP